MKKVQAEYPYDNYYLYVVHHKKENRNYVVLIPIHPNEGLHRTTLSYARYLMSIKLKRFLSSDEQVDHIDNDKTNDSIENLQILTRRENNIKECLRHNKKVLIYKCPCCGKTFYRKYSSRNVYKNYKSICCSRSCAGKFSLEIKKCQTKAKQKIEQNFIGIMEVPYATKINKLD